MYVCVCLFVCVCMYVCVYVSMYVYVCMCVYVCMYVCRTKKGSKTHGLLEISWYHRMFNVIDGVSHKPRSL